MALAPATPGAWRSQTTRTALAVGISLVLVGYPPGRVSGTTDVESMRPPHRIDQAAHIPPADPRFSTGATETVVEGTLHRWFVDSAPSFPSADVPIIPDTNGVEGQEVARQVVTVTAGARELRIPAAIVPPDAETGDTVSVRMLNSTPVSVSIVRPMSRGTVSLVSAQAVESRDIVVAVVTTQVPFAAPTHSAAQVASVMAGVTSYFEAVSGNRLSFATRVVSVTVDSLDCNGFYRDVSKARTAAGLSNTSREHFILYGVISGSECDYAGLGALNGLDVVIRSPYFDLQVVIHELGHNLGLMHSAGVRCPITIPSPETWSSRCTSYEYGDPFSPMGAFPIPAGPSANDLYNLGWLGIESLPIDVSGLVELAPLHGGATGSKALLLNDPASGGRYWLEYRDLSSYDGDVNPSRQVLVRYVHPDWLTLLIDLTPNDTSFTNAGLASVGQSFTSPGGHVSVSVQQLGDRAKLQVTTSSPPPLAQPVSGLVANDLGGLTEFSFSNPPNIDQVGHHRATLTYADGSTDSKILGPATTSGLFWGGLARPTSLAVTTTLYGGLEATATVQPRQVEPIEPRRTLISTKSLQGALVISVPPEESGAIYRFTVSAPGQPVRTVSGTRRQITVSGLPPRVGRWHVTTEVELAGEIIATGSRAARGVTSGGNRVTLRALTSSSIRIDTPSRLRTTCIRRRCTAQTITLWGEGPDGWTLISSSPVRRSGINVVETPWWSYGRLQVRIGSLQLTPISTPA